MTLAPGSATPLDPSGFPMLRTPCASGSKVPRGIFLGVRAVDVAGNLDPMGLSIPVPGPGAGFQGPESGIPTFAGARAEVGIGSPLSLMNLFLTFECKFDGGPWQRCRGVFGLPILHAGRHTMQVRQIVPGTRTYVTTRELVTTVAPSTLDMTIVGPQADLVIERGVSLTRRPPLVRLALNRPAAVQIEISRGGKRVVHLTSHGRTSSRCRQRGCGSSAPAATVTARGTSGR